MKHVSLPLSGFLKTMASDPEITLLFLQELWPQVVGEELARKTCPLGLDENKLVLGVQGEAWKKELGRIRPLLIGSINRFWGMALVERIECQVHRGKGGSGGKPGGPAEGTA